MFILDELEGVAYYQDLARKYSPLLNQVSLKRKLAEEGVKLQRAAFLPQVAAMGGAMFYNYQVSGLVPRWAVGVGVNFSSLLIALATFGILYLLGVENWLGLSFSVITGLVAGIIIGQATEYYTSHSYKDGGKPSSHLPKWNPFR